MTLEERIRKAEADLFHTVGAKVDESFLDLANTRRRVRLLAGGSGPPLILLHGVSLSAASWAPLFTALPDRRLLAIDLPGHGLSDPASYRRGHVRQSAHQLIEDIFDALELDRAPVVGHSLGAMFALWYAATGTERISRLVAIRRASRRAPRRPGADAAVAADAPRRRSGRPAFAQPRAPLSTSARPRPRSSRDRRRAGIAYRRAPPVRSSTGERQNSDFADARHRPLPPASS